MVRLDAKEVRLRLTTGALKQIPAIAGTDVDVEPTGITRESLDEVFVESFELAAVDQIHPNPVSTARGEYTRRKEL